MAKVTRSVVMLENTMCNYAGELISREVLVLFAEVACLCGL